MFIYQLIGTTHQKGKEKQSFHRLSHGQDYDLQFGKDIQKSYLQEENN